MSYTFPQKLNDSVTKTNATATLTFGSGTTGIVELRSLYVSVSGGTVGVAVTISGLNTGQDSDASGGAGEILFTVPANCIWDYHAFYPQEILANGTLTITATAGSGQTVSLYGVTLLTP